MPFNEFLRHQWLRQTLERHPFDPVGVGDDCSILEILPDDYLLISSDRVPLSAYRRGLDYVGRLCVVHNLSDIVCKGGTPLGMMIDTFVPRELPGDAWKDLIIAAQDCCRAYGAYILGGDTKEAPTLSVVGCALGTVKKDKLLLRSGARVGDVCAMTLTSGVKIGLPWAYHVIDSLQVPLTKDKLEWLEKQFVARNLSIPYRETLAANEGTGITASTDASDGIGGALYLLCNASGVGVRLAYDKLMDAVHDEAKSLATTLNIDPFAFAFSPGFTWENVFAVDPAAVETVAARVTAVGGRLLIIGEFVADPGAQVETADRGLRPLRLFYNEGFREERYISNSVEAWRAHRFID